MRKINILLVVLMVASALTSLATSISTVQAETNETELTNIIDEKYITLSYQTEVSKNRVHWLLKFNHQAQEKTNTQRLKFKITDEKEQTITYPVKENLLEKEGWLIEKNFSRQSDGQLAFELPETTERLYLSIQLAQQSAEGTKELIKQKEPYILELKNTMRTETSTSEKQKTQMSTGITKISSTEFVGPKQAEIQATSVGTAKQMYNPLYTNKVPQYKTDNSGTYPEFSWQPEGQDNVLNHQGGLENQSIWDSVTSWNVTDDNHDQSYIKYGDDAVNPNIQLRKYAQQTAIEDEFKIKLNVRGNTTYKPGVDIVFLLDNSDSMNNTESGESKNRKTFANEALDKIIPELKKVNIPSVENIRIGGHIFSDYSRNAWGYKPGEVRTFQLSEKTSDWDKLNSEYTRSYPLGATFTQRGLTEANDIFTDAPDADGRHKLLFVLTDGAPNLSWTTADKGTANKDMFVDRLHFTNFDKGTKGSYKDGSVLGTSGYKTTIIPAYNGVINSHITTTNSTAMDMKNAGIQIHAIALQLTVNVNETNKRDELMRGLYKMSSKKANGEQDPDKDTAEDFFFYNVEKGTELTEYFKSWYETIIRTVDRGIITDPLGDMVAFVTDEDKKPKVTQVENGAAKIEADDMPNVSIVGEQLQLNNINLTGNQEIEVEYTVRLKTDDPNFVSNQWYQTNKTTTLAPTPERSNDLIEFGVPSVKLQTADFVIPVKKIWSDTYQKMPNYWQLRASEVIATLQKKVEDTWQDVQSVKLNATNNWEITFSAVKGGAENSYRVVESSRVSGYKSPMINQKSFTSETIEENGIEITNELLTRNYNFSKFMGDGKTPFSDELPKFRITRLDGGLLAENVTPNNKGQVILNDVPIGDYIIEETYVPLGYQKMANIALNVSENPSATDLVFKVNNHTEAYTAINHLKDFSLTVEKIDHLGNSLVGASFKLIGPDQEETKVDGPTFHFENLRPGSYTLTETVNPSGYQLLKEPIQVTIAHDGKVTIAAHPNVSGSGGITETGNRIDLQVTNKKQREGALPRTGGVGLRRFYLVAGLLVSLGVILSGIYAYYNREHP